MAQAVLDLLDKKPNGLLPLLDEEVVLPRGSDATYVRKAVKSNAGNPHLSESRLSDLAFVVSHYAGQVLYSADGFVDKNKDHTPVEAATLLSRSSRDSLAVLFAAELVDVQLVAATATKAHNLSGAGGNNSNNNNNLLSKSVIACLF